MQGFKFLSDNKIDIFVRNIHYKNRAYFQKYCTMGIADRVILMTDGAYEWRVAYDNGLEKLQELIVNGIYCFKRVYGKIGAN